MNDRERNREEQLDRLFRMAGPESIRSLEPDPHLAVRIRALAAAGKRESEAAPRRWAPRWAWVSMASAAVGVCIFLGGFMGYRAAEFSLDRADALDDAEIFSAAWAQNGSLEDLSAFATDEVME